MKKTYLLFLILLTAPLWGTQKSEHKTEVKFSIPNLMQIDQPILQALKTGADHPDIVRRGFVVQEYLAVTKKNISNIFRALQEAGIAFGTADDFETFIYPGKTQEIRLLQKCIKEKGEIKTIYQITIFGPGGLSCSRLKTAEDLTPAQMQTLREIFTAFRPEVSSIARKLFFELVARDAKACAIIGPDGHERTVEVDVFLSNVDGKLTPTFINGEIHFLECAKEDAEREARILRQYPEKRPAYFDADVTDITPYKTRNIALIGVPATIQTAFADYKISNRYSLAKIAEEFTRWSTPEIVSLATLPPRGFIGAFIQKRVLLNAESFGFGPTAAIAEFFPYLRDRVAKLGYIGTGHTLDLQRKLPYDEIYDYSATDAETKKATFLHLAKDYDIFITASDFETASWAKSLGLQVIIYDPLTWYWPTLPEMIAHADFYVAQNFFGVEERIQASQKCFPETTVVPAIISGLHCPEKDCGEKLLLVNLGGLSNPYIQDADLISFAKAVVSVAHEVLEPEFDASFYVSSKAIAAGIQEICPTKSVLPHQVQKLLYSSKLAIMTSGLGNIYEASTMKKMVLWLPPANDSQGQQVKLLQQHGMADFAIDWHDIIDGMAPIDYFAPQQEVLQKIADCMRKLETSPDARVKLKKIFQDALQRAEKGEPNLASLANTFEVGGAKSAVEAMLQYLLDHPQK